MPQKEKEHTKKLKDRDLLQDTAKGRKKQRTEIAPLHAQLLKAAQE